MKPLVIFIISLFLTSCSLQSNIEITEDYISNKYWSDYNNAIHVERMKIKEGIDLDIFDIDFNRDIPNHHNITTKLEVDSSFYFGYSGLNIKSDKIKLIGRIFFNKDNGFEWYTNDGNRNIIGSLKRQTWYKISKLKSTPYYIYIFIDDNGKVHRFNQDLSNF